MNFVIILKCDGKSRIAQAPASRPPEADVVRYVRVLNIERPNMSECTADLEAREEKSYWN